MTKFMKVAEALGKTGLCVYPDFLSKVLQLKTRQDLALLQASGSFGRAGVGKGGQQAIHNQVRRDEICWLDRATANTIQTKLWKNLDSLKLAFNRTLFLGVADFEGHYAHYPKGGFYKKHLDVFQQDDARIVSFVLYLNADWQTPDGGQLRIYGKDSHIDVIPLGGTLVCFLSRESEHEVLLNSASRYSFTGWFKRASHIV